MSEDELEYIRSVTNLYKWVEDLKSLPEGDDDMFYSDLLPNIALIQHSADRLRKVTERLALEL